MKLANQPAKGEKTFSISLQAYILVFDITKWETFHCLNALKVDIERNHGKKESPVIMVLGNKVDLELESRQIDSDIVQKWASKEKGKCNRSNYRNRTMNVCFTEVIRY